jgi:trigger factor
MRRQSLDEQLERAGTTEDAYLRSAGLTAEQLAADMASSAQRSVKAGFVLDRLALAEDLNIEQEELNAFVIEQAYRMGVQPDRLAQELADRGQIGSAVSEVLRAKALSVITGRATVTDEAGQPVDVTAALGHDHDEQAGDEQDGDEQDGDEQDGEEQAEDQAAPAVGTAGEQPADAEPAPAVAESAEKPAAAKRARKPAAARAKKPAVAAGEGEAGDSAGQDGK